MTDETKITRLPPSEALGARDLQRWSQRRATGRAGVPPTRKDKRDARRVGLDHGDAAAQWLRQHGDDQPSSAALVFH